MQNPNNVNREDIEPKDLKLYRVNVDFGNIDIFSVGRNRDEAVKNIDEDDVRYLINDSIPDFIPREIVSINEIDGDWIDNFPFGTDSMTCREIMEICQEEKRKQEALAEFDRLQTNFDFFNDAGIKL